MNNSKRFIGAFVCVFGLISSLVTLTFGQTAHAATMPWAGELEYETSKAVPLHDELVKIAGPTVSFYTDRFGDASDEAVEDALNHARGFIFPSDEDFGS